MTCDAQKKNPLGVCPACVCDGPECRPECSCETCMDAWARQARAAGASEA